MNNFQEYLVSEKLINEIDNPVYKNIIKLGNQNLRDFKTEISKVNSPDNKGWVHLDQVKITEVY